MPKTPVISDSLAPPVGPFSPAVQGTATLYLSGQVGQDPATGRLLAGDTAAQAERIFANLAVLLRAAGRTFDDVLKVTVYLTDMSDFVAMNTVYAKYFGSPHPARTTIAVSALPLGAAIEIDVTAS